MSGIAIAGSGGAANARIVLAANTNYYVASTGNDSNPGTLAQPWLTLTHAMIYIAMNLDIAGFIVTVNIGAGSFAGVGMRSTVGGGIIYFKGAGSGSTTITDGPNDGVFNNGECFTAAVSCGSSIFINAMTVKQSGNHTFNFGVVLYVPGIDFNLYDPVAFTFDIIFDCSLMHGGGQTAALSIQAPSGIFDLGLTSITGGGGTVNNFASIQNGGYWQAGGNCAVTGALTVNESFVVTALGGIINLWTSLAITGAGVVGQRFLAQGGDINNTGRNLNAFPGTVAGTVTDGGEYG